MKSIFQDIADIEKTNKPAALCIVISTKGSSPRKAGSKMIVFEDGSITGTIGGGSIEKEVIEEARKVIISKNPFSKEYMLKNDVGMLCGGSMEVYIEPVERQQKLLVFGAGHIARTLVKFATELGFSITIVDERPGILDDPAFENCMKLNIIHNDAIEKIEFDSNTYIVIITHKHIHDAEILKLVCKKKNAYLGMIGSKPKVAEIKKEFIKEKILTAEQFDLIDSPIGIKLAANTPQEIAVCIIAKLIDVRNKI
jgi:xanthine dehydrogenase accessory factor